MSLLIQGETPVVINRYLPPGHVQEIDGTIHAQSIEAVQRVVEETNRHWYLIRTSPTCLVHRETGEMVELPDPPAGRCAKCGVRHA